MRCMPCYFLPDKTFTSHLENKNYFYHLEQNCLWMNYKISKQKRTSYWINKHIQGIYVSAMTNVVHNKIGITTLAYVYSKNHTKDTYRW